MVPRGCQHRDFGSKNGYKKRSKYTLSFTSDSEANFHEILIQNNVNYSVPVEAGTLKLRNRCFAHKSDFDTKKSIKSETK